MNKSKLYIELAKTMKDLITEEMSKKGKIGMVIGEVLDPPPNLRVKIEDQIILKKNQIILAAHVNADYKRTFEIITGDDKASKLTSGKVKTNKTGIMLGNPKLTELGAIPIPPDVPASHTLVAPSGTGAIFSIDPKHDHDLSDGNEFSAEGTIKWTDTLKKGDKVIMIPDRTEKFFVLIDKAERL